MLTTLAVVLILEVFDGEMNLLVSCQDESNWTEQKGRADYVDSKA
jgi:hypothetical protein